MILTDRKIIFSCFWAASVLLASSPAALAYSSYATDAAVTAALDSAEASPNQGDAVSATDQPRQLAMADTQDASSQAPETPAESNTQESAPASTDTASPAEPATPAAAPAAPAAPAAEENP